LVANQDDDVTFFCGGSRNFKQFIDLFDAVFILDVDVATLNERLDSRPDDWGKSQNERELILRLHATKEDIPGSGIVIDATQPLVSVVVYYAQTLHLHSFGGPRWHIAILRCKK